MVQICYLTNISYRNNDNKAGKRGGNLDSSPPVNDPDKLQPQGFCNHTVDLSVCVLRQRSNEDIANCLKYKRKKL